MIYLAMLTLKNFVRAANSSADSCCSAASSYEQLLQQSLTNDAVGLFLYLKRRFPWTEEILERHVPQHGHVAPDVGARRIHLHAVGDGREAHGALQAVLERRARNPHPVAGANRPISVE